MLEACWSPGYATRPDAPCPLSGVPGDLFVRILEPLDELLDADVVGQDLRGGGHFAPEDAAQRGIKEDHGSAAERPVWAAGLQEQHGRGGEAAHLDLPGNLLDEIVALLFRMAMHRNQCVTVSISNAAVPVTR